MKKVITAVGNEKLNNMLKEKDGIVTKASDIQYQEGIIEALEEYQDIDILILKDDLIGGMETEELIRRIIMTKQNIEIILVAEECEGIQGIKQIVKIIDKTYNYENQVVEFLESKDYIKHKKATSLERKSNVTSKDVIIEEEKFKQVVKKKRYVEERKINKKEVITVIGKAGVRKDNIYFYYCKTFKEQKDTYNWLRFNKQ